MKEATLKKKQQVVDEVISMSEGSAGVILCNYSGLTVSAVNKFRNELRQMGAQYKVVKNTMIRRAFADVEGLDEHLHGTTGVVYTGSDFGAAAKCVATFAKDHKDAITVKCGVYEGKVISRDDVIAISELPPREVLIAKLLGSLNAPITNFVGVLGGVPRKFLYLLNGIKDQKSA
ncbi:50S ribosomal protein L10 [Desulfurispira natronophila]|uniref:Large ribosomal subunit protein uL10 n=1 Tax=Desulfurispira natronophila TaxID=682562 RepID=A0A7W7Y554_9BACT|nr:50S ribosomal protein L10 [Desulfurispira natronophila]MBB5022283.1 large subunit ribosomal protein L10 [Desulfurispira natronophila]